MTLNGTARSYATEATSNRLTSISNPTRGFGYDVMGNTLSDTGLAYTTTYRLDGRMGTLTKACVTRTYSYDAGGQRVRKRSGSTTTHFNYDQDGQLLGQYSGTTPSQEYVWLGGVPVAVLHGASQDPEVLYVFSDHLGAPRVLVDKNNGGRWRWISEPFGNTAAEEAPGGLAPVTLNLRFPGQYFDKESGLSYNYFRDYDGTTGRYVQSDPIGLDGGINTYSYVNGNPLSFYDPYGLWGMDDVYGAVYNWTGGWEPSQGLVDAAAGFGDGVSNMATVGLYSTADTRNSLGTNGEVNRCSGMYMGGKFVGSTLPGWGRIAYMVRVGSVGRGVKTLEQALAASQTRNAVKGYFRGPLARFFSDYKTEAQVLERYGADAKAIAEAASRSNPYFNSLAFTTIYAASLRTGFSAMDCECQK